MVGAILGDIIGSRWEFNNIKTKDFPLFSKENEFTDDTVMTCAVAEALMRCDGDYENLSKVTFDVMHSIGRKYPTCGYGGMFFHWMLTDKDPQPYNSFGNGSAMRVSPVGFIAKDIAEAKMLSRKVTEITHNHPEGIKGAEATAVAIVMARQGKSKEEILKYIGKRYYDLNWTVDGYRDILDGHGAEICQVSVPQAFVCFKEGNDYEDVIRNCISIGGDSDTIAAIAGGIAEAYYGVKNEHREMIYKYLDKRLTDIVERFEKYKNEVA